MKDLMLVLFVVALGVGMLVACFPFLAPLLAKPGKSEGTYVAEVWLEWSLCRGSTVYRQRFKTMKQAAFFVRMYARLIDYMLPKGFVTKGRNGRPLYVSNDMGIKYGVREMSVQEQASFSVIWSPCMPGERGFSGEHASAHPVFGDLVVSEEGRSLKI